MTSSPSASTAEGSALARILWIEGDEVVTGRGCQFLARTGYSVTFARATDLTVARSGIYHLIIHDRRLPDSGGREALLTLCAAAAQTPVIVCAGYPDGGKECALGNSGNEAVYPKPRRCTACLKRIRALLYSETDSALNRHLRWHDRMLAGDVNVREEFAAEFLPALGGRLRRRWPRADEGLIGTAVTDALMEYFRTPIAYDRSRLALDGFLAVIAQRRFQDLQRAVHRRLQHERAVGDALPDWVGDVAFAVSRWRDLRAVMRVCRTRAERAFMHARLRGERRIPVLAAILGLTHLPPQAQRTGVYRVWDRLRLRLRRGGGVASPK
jgi:CheY-like chemotaxis protein